MQKDFFYLPECAVNKDEKVPLLVDVFKRNLARICELAADCAYGLGDVYMYDRMGDLR